jgi:methanogenic corrinoid protein MtbC1
MNIHYRNLLKSVIELRVIPKLIASHPESGSPGVSTTALELKPTQETYPLQRRGDGSMRRTIVSTLPGSRHLAGVSVVAELFREDGWEVVADIAHTQNGLIQTVGSEWFDLVSLSVGFPEQLTLLPPLITQLKHSSKNKNVPVVLCGAAFLESDVQGLNVGADGISADLADAVMLANELIQKPATTLLGRG